MWFFCENYVYFFECVVNIGMEWCGVQLNGCQFIYGMIYNVMYIGVLLCLLFEEVGVKINGKWIMLEGVDVLGMICLILIEKVLDDCFVVFKMNGEVFCFEQGYLVCLVVFGWEGNMWVKWFCWIEVGDELWYYCEEILKYIDFLENGQVCWFIWEMDVKLVIINLSLQVLFIGGFGLIVLIGVVWLGCGIILWVDVIIDGGKNWYQVCMFGLSLNKLMYCFYFEFDWDGKLLLL